MGRGHAALGELREGPVRGGCVTGTTSPGGLLAIEEHFGPVQVISGLYTDSEAGIEGDPAVHAVRQHLPERRLGFGYPDHGSTATGDYSANLAALMRDLTPSIHTSGTMFWMDDILRINDGNPVDQAKSLNIQKGRAEVASQLAKLDRDHPNVLLSHIGAKYLYTKDGSSPTQYAYSHPDAPELPASELKTPQEIERAYNILQETLTWLVEVYLEETPDSRFVSSGELLAAVDTQGFRQVTRAELDVMARWALLGWGDAPPSFVSDGLHFYSLRDLFNLLTLAFSREDDPLTLPMAYGPLGGADAPTTIALSAAELAETAALWADRLTPSGAWRVTPNNLLPDTMEVAGQKIPLAQVLYAMAYLYAAAYAGEPRTSVEVPASMGAPPIRQRLRALGCKDCTASSWSIKPATLLAH